MMDVQMIKRIEELALQGAAVRVDENGEQWAPVSYTRVMKVKPTSLDVTTLTGFVTLAKKHIETEKDLICVCTAQSAVLYGPRSRSGERYVLVECAAPKSNKGLGDWLSRPYSVEQFIVGLLSRFRDGEDRRKVLAVVGTVRSSDVQTLHDDGVTQTVTRATGIMRAEKTELPTTPMLSAMRSFPEIVLDEQPFVLRMNKEERGGGPTVFLHEADGAAWERDASCKVAAFIRERCEGLTVVE
jgi:hypothetical protein